MRGHVARVSACGLGACLVSAVCLCAQAVREDQFAHELNRPLLGYVVSTGPLELRAILGVPGAAEFSDPIPLPDGLRDVRVAPNHSFALLQFSDGAVAVLTLNGLTTGEVMLIEGAVPMADWVRFSPSSGRAVLFSADRARLEVISGLPDSARVERNVDFQAWESTPRSAAISDDSESILISTRDGVYLLARDGSTRLLVSVTDGAVLAFFRDSGNAAIVDRAAGAVHLLERGTGGGMTIAVSNTIDEPGDIVAGADGETLYVAAPKRQRIWMVNPRGEARAVDVPIAPLRLEPLWIRDAILIPAKATEPAWIFFRQNEEHRCVFVPRKPQDPRL